MNKTYRIASVPGDGVGHEIIPAALDVLDIAAKNSGFAIQTTEFPYGAGHYKKTGTFMPDEGLEEMKSYDAILFGAVGLPDVDDRLPAKDFTFKVRTRFQQYVNYRPVRIWPGVTRPLGKKRI
jgi:tartrate dehydrogenase/decarboxylase/D-malate dehydrogenase